MSRTRFIGWFVLTAIAALCIAGSYAVRFRVEQRFAREVALARQAVPAVPQISFTSLAVPRGVPFASILARMNVDTATTQQIISVAQSVFNFRLLQAGNELKIGRTVLGAFAELRYEIDPLHTLEVENQNGQLHAEVKTIPVTTENDPVNGKVADSLFDAVTQAGESPELAMRIADIFSWDLDFNTETRPGDTFRVVVEKKKLANGQLLGYGKILAAEYVNDGRPYRAVLFHDPQGRPAYYTPAGKSLKKAFLHSPLRFGARITSHFSYSRFHPILRLYRPHLGTDYGAPAGTPVQTIGDGRVIYAGWKGEDGRLVKIQHINGYETYYMHLSRILVHVGERVSQGQIIGRVGMTGLATGPHLDFRIERHGSFVNFEHLPLPPTNPVAKGSMAEFTAVCEKEMALLPQPGTSFASATPSASGSTAPGGTSTAPAATPQR
ncbi:MAG TPA: peptidoglycan DD-metalloendopeptidase family protein [Candidatus Acidoferrales bacterium]|nr:peptidoglycan DD-metalloendopeptidase family protein [Candidatus Acidoferrales bacterium]